MIKFGNKVLVSDPCYKYDGDDRYVAVLNNVQPGNYNTIVKIGDEKGVELHIYLPYMKNTH